MREEISDLQRIDSPIRDGEDIDPSWDLQHPLFRDVAHCRVHSVSEDPQYGSVEEVEHVGDPSQVETEAGFEESLQEGDMLCGNDHCDGGPEEEEPFEVEDGLGFEEGEVVPAWSGSQVLNVRIVGGDTSEEEAQGKDCVCEFGLVGLEFVHPCREVLGQC